MNRSTRAHYVGGVKLSLNSDLQALTNKLINNVQRTKGAPVVGSVVNKILQRDRVPALGFETHAGAVIRPKAISPGLCAGHFQPVTSPQVLNPLVINLPRASLSRTAKRRSILTAKLHHIHDQPRFTGIRPFGQQLVSGQSRVPIPAANSIARISFTNHNQGSETSSNLHPQCFQEPKRKLLAGSKYCSKVPPYSVQFRL